VEQVGTMQKGEERRGNKDGKWGRRRKEKE
jgi:hypothetical protein